MTSLILSAEKLNDCMSKFTSLVRARVGNSFPPSHSQDEELSIWCSDGGWSKLAARILV